jgi:short-subunit dehydrogenase
MPSRKTQTTRDRNLAKIFVALPLLVTAIVTALRAVAGSTLGGVGLLALLYCGARMAVALRGWTPRVLRRPRAQRLKREGRCIRGAALVTGCTQGLGRAFARGLVERGVPVVLVSRDQTKLEALAGDLQSEFPGASCRLIAHDFAGPAGGFYAKVAEVIRRDVALVVNNVGVVCGRRPPTPRRRRAPRTQGVDYPLTHDELDESMLENMITVNCCATAKMCRVALPLLAERGGVIVNVGSGSAAQPTPYLSHYSATKAFVEQLSRSLDREWRPRNVRVLCAAPYYVSSTGLYKARASWHAPPAQVIVDGVFATLGDARQGSSEVIRACVAHEVIGVLFTAIAEDPVLSAIGAPVARLLGASGSMVEVMAKARGRYLASSGPGGR